ncbi:MAG: helix-turn-helix domain-containing protein [Nitratireductor sp.]|nr:helix-turn-helix domain-containing protein [Nitratireductor sp.]
MKILDIGDVAARSGLAPSALRYYDDIGLISAIGRNGLRRQFGPEVLLQLALIAMGKSAGFTLEEIAGMFTRDGRPDLPREKLQHKASQLDRQIGELAALRDLLRHVADCPAPSHLECPTFRRLIEVSMRRNAKGGRKRSGRAK